MEFVNCNLCNNKRYKLFKVIDDYQLVRCRQCGLVYQNPRPTQKEISSKYSKEYQFKRLLRQEPKTEEEIEIEIGKNAGRAEEIVKQFGNKGKLLDIGCSAGFFIACLKRYGWDVTGIDISEWASDFARNQLGLNVYTGTVDKVRFYGQFDIITMYHILEHLPDPLKTLKRVHTILKDGGTLLIKGPNLGSFDRIWHGKNWRGYEPLHFYYFTPGTYNLILKKAGFFVQKVIFQYWDPFFHLMEIRLGDGIRADHPSDVIENSKLNNNISKFFGVSIRKVTGLLNLKGRDLTIYAKKDIEK
jgi:2-polyprenyl-3-methyl-5-hydroxy-6-metoxy-1,4-benzoquinol methylase